MLTTYLSYQLITRDISKSMSRIQSQPMIQRETEYYLANIGKVKSIEEFVNDDRLFRYAMKAHGLEDMAYAKAFMVKALEEGVSDPESFANKLTDKRYAEFVKAYNFEKYGELATSFNAALHDVPDNFALQVELGISQEGYDQHKAETAYYLANISDVKSIDDLMADERLLSYSLAAFGLDAETESRERIREMLEGGVSDPQSPANRLYDKRYAAFVAAFDFVEHGEGTTARDEVQKAVPEDYMAGTGLFVVKPRAEYVKVETEYYLANISDVKSIDDLLTDKRLLAFAMASYGLDAATESPERIREMLEGGISDPDSPANKLADKSYVAFVAAFNFVEHGELTTSRDEVLTETPKLYGIKSELGLIKPSADYVRAETAYYLANVTELQSIDELMADKRLLDFALFSYGIDPAAHKPEYIRSLLEGGISDPDSPANKLTDKRYAAFVAAFNFHAHGEMATTYAVAQQPVADKYIRQSLEEDAGTKNEGVRLALYFERKAPDLTSYYEILADPALAQVVRTALGFPAALAQADIDKQVELMKERFDLEELKDPEKLAEFLKRFTSLWEIENPSSQVQSPIVALFAQPPEFGISTDMLLTIAQLKR